MRLILHGGKCCGMKQIFGMGHSVSEMCPAKRATKRLANEGDQYLSSKKDFHYPAAPAETMGARLDRYLALLDAHRPQGICEIILADHQLYVWRDFIKERGFVEVNKCKNSNSGNMIHVFHRNKE